TVNGGGPGGARGRGGGGLARTWARVSRATRAGPRPAPGCAERGGPRELARSRRRDGGPRARGAGAPGGWGPAGGGARLLDQDLPMRQTPRKRRAPARARDVWLFVLSRLAAAMAREACAALARETFAPTVISTDDSGTCSS